MQSVIIADTSCLVILSKINKLHILNDLYGNIIITTEVAAEFGEEIPKWIDVRDIKNQISQTLINSSIDLGEASSIALAMEFPDPLLILDDLKARNFAESLNLSFTGTIGVLMNAKRKQIIPNLKAVFSQIEKTDFRISKDLINQALKLSGE
jgi:predicted nucleic acid-binding protein